MDTRTQELKENLDTVSRRIDDAVAAAGRADRPELIVVTKYFPAADAVRLAQLGAVELGENKDQEAGPKAAEVAAQLGEGAPRWHFIGQLQSNKAKSVVRYAHAVHSVDRAKLVGALSRGALSALESGERAAHLECLIQADLRDPVPDDGRGGASPDAVPGLADAIAEADGLTLGGLMAVAPLDEDPRPAFERLAALAERLRADHPAAVAVSAGMSRDLEAAVACGATHLRVGRDVLGERPAPR
ncbi:YggS family pyridoxal phosphate-dependent enzyme [Nesterenkonia populi]